MYFTSVTNNDLDQIRKLQPEGWPPIIPEFEFYIKSDFCFPLKVQVDDKIVGVGVSIVHESTAWIAHIIVDSNCRNRGIGSQIVDKLLKNLKKKSVVSCSLIATELGKPVYEKAGFRIVTEYTFLKRERPWKNYPVSKNIISYKEEFQSQIFELDKKIYGENREKLLKGYVENSLIYEENKKVSGCFFPGLREGLIIADEVDAGLELMKVKYAQVDKAVLPSDNIDGINFLKQNGFVVTDKTGTRMVLGKNINWIPQKIYSRIGGNLG